MCQRLSDALSLLRCVAADKFNEGQKCTTQQPAEANNEQFYYCSIADIIDWISSISAHFEPHDRPCLWLGSAFILIGFKLSLLCQCYRSETLTTRSFFISFIFASDVETTDLWTPTVGISADCIRNLMPLKLIHSVTRFSSTRIV